MKVDIFPHIFPKRFFDRMVEVAPDKDAIKRWLNIPVLWDLDARLRMMDEFGKYPADPHALAARARIARWARRHAGTRAHRQRRDGGDLQALPGSLSELGRVDADEQRAGLPGREGRAGGEGFTPPEVDCRFGKQALDF